MGYQIGGFSKLIAGILAKVSTGRYRFGRHQCLGKAKGETRALETG